MLLRSHPGHYRSYDTSISTTATPVQFDVGFYDQQRHDVLDDVLLVNLVLIDYLRHLHRHRNSELK